MTLAGGSTGVPQTARRGAARRRLALMVLLSVLAAGSGALGVHLLSSGRVLAAADAGAVPVVRAATGAPPDGPRAAAGTGPGVRRGRDPGVVPAAVPYAGPARPRGAAPAPAAPVRLEIGTTAGAQVVPVGADGGQLRIPESPRTVGWWVGSAPSGAAHGSTLLAGHVDSSRQGAGTFARLHELPLGTRIMLTDVFGARHAYLVTARRSYPKLALPADVFRTGGRPRLLLVTCGGPFDHARGRYRDNLVVYALPDPAPSQRKERS